MVKDPFLNGTTPDVLADDADSTAVETQGDWEHVERFEIPQPYKGTYFISKEKSEKGQWLRFKANIKKPGSYGVYLFHPIVLGWKKPYSPNTTFSIKANGEIAQKSIDFSHLPINQNWGEWVDLGSYKFSGTGEEFVELVGEKSLPPLVADAIIFVWEDENNQN